jgi:hypothetical protein
MKVSLYDGFKAVMHNRTREQDVGSSIHVAVETRKWLMI